MDSVESGYHGDELAIIGMSGRFPRADSVAAFWQNLRDGVEGITFLSDPDLIASGVDPELLRHPQYVKARGVLEGVEWFDAAFFGFTPREAELLDPQHRLFLECAWEALEQAGYAAETSTRRTGVFVSSSTNSYAFRLYAHPELAALAGDFQINISNDKDYLPTRVSYKLNLTGPSMNIQSACSSSLVAVHLACQSLLNGECDMALAGGVAIRVPQKIGYLYQVGGVASPDGHCRAFDAQAQGTPSGSGVGVVLLKRLDAALDDGDTIHAVVKGSAINNDGAAKIGYTAPSVQGQARAIGEALAMARVAPESIRYVETHGSGTPLGDPIEIAALTQVFRGAARCAIGSLKTNVGHLDAAAGVASLIKTALSLQQRQIPPSLHFTQPNPEIDFASSPFYVNTALAEWPAEDVPRRAGVSSFGIGGTNVHVVLEEAPEVEPSSPARPWQLLLLSARTDSALEAATDDLADLLTQRPDLNLADVAYTVQVGRRAFPYRRALVCRDAADAVGALRERDPRRILTSFQEARRRPVAFMFSGLGDQYERMAEDLYRDEPIFRAQVDRCCELLAPHLGLDLRAVLYPNSQGTGDRGQGTGNGGQGADVGEYQTQNSALKTQNSSPPHLVTPSKETAPALDFKALLAPRRGTHPIHQTALAHPAMFVVEYALAQLWLSWGLRPQALIGYSLGEYVAACLAGVFSLDDALRLVARRAQLIAALPGGAMLAVPLAEQEARSLLGAGLDLAAINGPGQCVLAGSDAAIAALEAQLAERGVATRRLQTMHAFHSELLRPISADFAAQLRQITLHAPSIPYLSNLTGTWISADQATDPDYWVRQMCGTVRFADGLRELLSDPERVLLEIGPGQSLCGLALQYPAVAGADERVVLASLRHVYDPRPDQAVLLSSAAQLWLAGVALDWAGRYRGERRLRLPLPTYPFERQRYWIDPPRRDATGEPGLAGARRRPNVADWLYRPAWAPSLLPPPFDDAATAERACWLVFRDECGLGDLIAARLARAGQQVTVVLAGERFGRRPDGSYTLDPSERADYEALLADLRERGLVPRRIVHLWSVAEDAGQSSRALFEEVQRSGFYSLLFLAQALARQPETDPLHCWVVSNGVQRVESGDALQPAKATVLGPCKTVPQEYPHMTFRSVDVVLPQPETWQAARLLDQLMAELSSPSPDLVIAYRGIDRWTQTFEPVRPAEGPRHRARLRENGVYLITGGLGRDSLVRASYLARTLQARLALLGRSGLPERAAWEPWLATHADDDPTSVRIRKVQELEASGAEVMLIAADVANAAQMRAALQAIDERFGALHGVIHAAGMTDPASARPIAELGPVESEWHFQPKVYGLYVLEEVLRGRALDFCLLTSSVAAIVGGLGLCAYTAASIFMDAFAARHNQGSPAPWTSMNWEGATPEQTVEAFERIIGLGPLTQIVVSGEELQARIERRIKLGFLRGAAPSQQASHARPRLRNPYVAPTSPIEQRVVDLFQGVLGIEPIGIHDSFFALGGDSLVGTQLIAHLRGAFQVDLPLRALFELPTPAGLAEEIIRGQTSHTDDEQLARMLADLEQLSEDEVERLLAEDQGVAEGHIDE